MTHGKASLALTFFVTLGVSARLAPAELPAGVDGAAIAAAAAASFPEYLELLSIPNDSIRPADIQRNAAWLEAAFSKRGFAARQLANKGKPLVFAEYGGNRPPMKTILFYIHFDGQPVIPSQWDGPFGGPALVGSTDRFLTLPGRCGIPPTAIAVVANVTVTQPTAAGSLSLYPAGSMPAGTSTISYRAGQTRGNNARLAIGTDGAVFVRCTQPSGGVHLIVDVSGYFE